MPVSLENDQVLRDEFCCPIHQELMVDPVIAADGHTYDRSSISRWLSDHDSSPKTGQALPSLQLVQNHNLKRLISDLIREGGGGLYTQPKQSLPCDMPIAPSRQLVKERMLILHCIESSSQGQTGRAYVIGQGGADGGRTRKTDALSRSWVPFLDDPSVSRKHFKISFFAGQFHISDLGSGSGVLVRIPRAVGHTLHVGTIIAVGKHQLKCTGICAQGSDRAAGEPPSLRLLVIAPSGSPMEGREFEIGQGEVATLGRKEDCTISFTVSQGKEGAMGIDSAISMVHCRIISFRAPGEGSHRFVVLDGSEHKPSSNGTWVRLSPMHQDSEPWPLEAGTEVVVGSSRFQVELGDTVTEVAQDKEQQPPPSAVKSSQELLSEKHGARVKQGP